jgi:nitrile hydratase
VQGRVGEVVELRRSQPLPGESLGGGGPAELTPVYAVRFAAAELWGAGDHSVTLDLWEHYLEEAGNPGAEENP